MQKMQVRFLGREDPLEKEMATHSSILAWRILKHLDCFCFLQWTLTNVDLMLRIWSVWENRIH